MLLSFSFEGCILDYSSFSRLKIKGTIFNQCKMEEVDFVESDLTSASFHACDLTRASFEKSILIGADLRAANNYSIDPESTRISKAKFSLDGIPGLLDKYDIVIE
jgi:uncharacterized protein YjbI with pentapeptide repeats